MKLTYDLRHNFAYLRICAKPDSVKTIHISDELNVVVARDGTVCGIKFLKATQQLTGTDQGYLVIVNDAKADQRKVPLGLPPGNAIHGAPLWQLKMRGTPLSEQQEVVLRFCEEEGLTHQAIALRVGVSLVRVRTIYATGKALQEDYARNGVETLLLLPTRLRQALEKLNLASRSKVKAAIATRELGWNKRLNRLAYNQNRRGTSLGWDSWLLLQEWASLRNNGIYAS